MGDHMAALRTLALTLHDVAAAEAYARRHLAPPDYRALLHLVLDPGQGREPRWEDACYLISALGRAKRAASRAPGAGPRQRPGAGACAARRSRPACAP